MSMMTTVRVGRSQSGSGGGDSYIRGPTFFLNRGPANSKSGPDQMLWWPSGLDGVLSQKNWAKLIRLGEIISRWVMSINSV